MTFSSLLLTTDTWTRVSSAGLVSWNLQRGDFSFHHAFACCILVTPRLITISSPCWIFDCIHRVPSRYLFIYYSYTYIATWSDSMLPLLWCNWYERIFDVIIQLWTLTVMKCRPIQSGKRCISVNLLRTQWWNCLVLFTCFFFYLTTLQVINDLLDPTGQNLRIREDAQVGVVLFIKIYFVITHSCPFNFAQHKKLNCMRFVLFICYEFSISITYLGSGLSIVWILFLIILEKDNLVH